MVKMLHLLSTIYHEYKSHALDVTNSWMDMIVFVLSTPVRIVSFRSMHHYKIKHSVLQQNLSIDYRFEAANKIWEEYSNFTNTLKKEILKNLYDSFLG